MPDQPTIPCTPQAWQWRFDCEGAGYRQFRNHLAARRRARQLSLIDCACLAWMVSLTIAAVAITFATGAA